jgi:NAD(P)-dependent dehydrogenase (short-subunit alcohol dehydrogenase family)
MTVNTSIEMTGLREAIRSLNKIEPGLRKEFTAQATRIAQPAITEAQRGYQREYLSGMARKWTQNGKKIFPFSVAKAVSGVKLKVDASREAVSLIYITQTNVAAAVFEAAGRANANRVGESLAQLRQGSTRVVGPAVFLASNMSSYVTGVTIPVDGGYLAL